MYVKKLAVILATLVLLVIAAPAALAAESGSTWDQVKAAGSDIWGTVKEKAPGVWENTKDKASEIYGKVQEKAPEVKEKIQTGVSNAQEKISDYRAEQEDEFWQWFENQTTGSTQATVNNAEPDTPVQDSPTIPPVHDDELLDDTGEMPAEVLEQYTESEIFYHQPENGAEQDTPQDNTEQNTEDLPDEIIINGKVYRYAPADEQKPPVKDKDELDIGDEQPVQNYEGIGLGEILLFLAIAVTVIITIFMLGIRLIGWWYDKRALRDKL